MRPLQTDWKQRLLQARVLLAQERLLQHRLVRTPRLDAVAEFEAGLRRTLRPTKNRK